MAFQQQDMGGVLFKNDRKKPDSQQPDYRGNCVVNGQTLDIAAWIKEGKRGKFMSLKFQEPRQQEGGSGMGEYGQAPRGVQPAQRPHPRPAPLRPQSGGYQGELPEGGRNEHVLDEEPPF